MARYDYQYERKGTLTYLAALDIRSGQVISRISESNGIAPFIHPVRQGWFPSHWIIPFLLVIIPLSIALLDAYAQGQSEETSFLRENGFLTRWLALGPFIEGEPATKAIEVDYLFLATGIPESKFAALEGAPKTGDGVSLTLEGYATQERIWKVLELPENNDVNAMLVKEG
jgi:hypothetical protein